MSQPKASPMELPLSNPFFDHPILNSPYECPRKHWELDPDGQPTQQVLETRRRAEFITPIPKPKKRKKTAQQNEMVFDEGKSLSTAAQQYDITSIINQVRQPDGLEIAKAEHAHFGDGRLVRDVSDLYLLPQGIKGWLFPAHLDDTTVICMRTLPQELVFGVLVHPVTEQLISFRTSTEKTVPGYAAAQRDDAATQRQV